MRPSYAERLRPWAARIGAAVDDVRYPRPEAEGEVAALRLRPAGPARARVVAVHGAGNDAVFPLLALFRGLLERGAEVFSFDVDGHGPASTTRFARDTVRSALPAAVERAEGAGARLPLHLVGHSLGGSLVLDALAAGRVEHAASATVISAPLRVEVDLGTALTELRGFFRRSVLAQREHYGTWGLVPAFGPIKRGAYPFRRANEDGRAWSYIGAVQELLAELRLEERAPRVTTPTLLVYSRGDRLAEHGDGERLAGSISGAELLLLTAPTHYGVPFAPETIRRTAVWIERRTRVGV